MGGHRYTLIFSRKANYRFLTKYILLCLSFMIYSFCVNGQAELDCIIAKYNRAKTEDDKGKTVFYNLLRSDSTMDLSLKMLSFLQKQDDPIGIDYTRLAISLKLTETGDYTTVLEQFLELLSNFEKRKDDYGKMYSFSIIANAFAISKDYDQSVAYYKRELPLALTLNDTNRYVNTLNDIGDTYAKAGMPDSGMQYAQQAVNYCYQYKWNFLLAYALGTLGENYMGRNEYEIALSHFRKSYAWLKEDLWGTLQVSNDFAKCFLGLEQRDSAIHYARHAITKAKMIDAKDELLTAYESMYKIFERTNQQDSLNKYFRLAMLTKDTLFNVEKNKVVQAMAFEEKLREQEIEMQKQKTDDERKTNIQYAAIAIGLIAFVCILLLLTRSILINEKWISFLGILGLLIVFEFINLLFHPFLERITRHNPVLMLGALVVIAALLIPLHHRLEKWVKEKMVEKNKQIRLEAAKRTIEELEGEKK